MTQIWNNLQNIASNTGNSQLTCELFGNVCFDRFAIAIHSLSMIANIWTVKMKHLKDFTWVYYAEPHAFKHPHQDIFTSPATNSEL